MLARLADRDRAAEPIAEADPQAGSEEGEKRGDHYVTGGLGYLHQVLRLPDFLGGPVFLGGWVETGSAFNDTDSAEIDFHGSTGLIADTLIGPVFLGASVGSSGDSRYYIGIGKIFR